MIRAALIIALLALAASMSYTDKQQAYAEYTSMVCAGHWPDYKQVEPECK